MKEVTMIVNGKSYPVQLTSNPTTRELAKHLPLDIKMQELNGNEKYHDLSYKLPAHDQPVHHIKAGDIMLYNSNCIVLFYKDFTTSYSYTKIGHVKDFKKSQIRLGKKDVQIKFESKE